MKIRHILFLAITSFAGGQEEAASRLDNVPTLYSQPQFKARHDWEKNHTFYHELDIGLNAEVARQLHPCFGANREEIAKALILRTKDAKLGESYIRWKSVPAFVKIDEGGEKADASATSKQRVLMLVMVYFEYPGHNPGLEKDIVQDNGEVVKAFATATPRLDLWIREGGPWQVIPHELLRLEKVFENPSAEATTFTRPLPQK